MIFSASADLLNARGMIIPRALHKSADAEKITIKLQVTDIYISNFSQRITPKLRHIVEIAIALLLSDRMV